MTLINSVRIPSQSTAAHQRQQTLDLQQQSQMQRVGAMQRYQQMQMQCPPSPPLSAKENNNNNNNNTIGASFDKFGTTAATATTTTPMTTPTSIGHGAGLIVMKVDWVFRRWIPSSSNFILDYVLMRSRIICVCVYCSERIESVLSLWADHQRSVCHRCGRLSVARRMSALLCLHHRVGRTPDVLPAPQQGLLQRGLPEVSIVPKCHFDTAPTPRRVTIHRIHVLIVAKNHSFSCTCAAPRRPKQNLHCSLCEMLSRNQPQRLGAQGARRRLPFGVLLVRHMRPAAVHRRTVCDAQRSDPVPRALHGNDGDRNWIEWRQCGQREEEQTRADGVHRGAAGGAEPEFRNWQQSGWAGFGADSAECGTEQAGDASVVSEFARPPEEAFVPAQAESTWVVDRANGCIGMCTNFCGFYFGSSASPYDLNVQLQPNMVYW